MINGYWLGLAFVRAGTKVQREGKLGFCCAIGSQVDERLSPNLCYRFLTSLAELLSVMTIIKVVVDTLMICCHELPVADA